ncbi:MAG TPA: ABC transporter substrate-binding protein [Phycisphaerales bacterium]|nr:ABC transporter substrate-binding protein [Phycisphaerales bacterium]
MSQTHASTPPATSPPGKVISTSPAVTDILCALGAADLLVGRSAACDHPGAARVPVVETLAAQEHEFAAAAGALRAGLVFVGDATVPNPAQASASIRVVQIAPRTIEGIWDAILTVGREVDRAQQATDLVVALRERFFAANEFVNPYDDGPITVFLESIDPLICSGDWISQLVERAGAIHALNPTTPKPHTGIASGPQFAERTAGRAVRVPIEVLTALNPPRVILCPKDGTLDTAAEWAANLSTHDWWRSLRAVRTGGVALVAGTATFHRPGPGIVDAYEWLVAWLHNLPTPSRIPWRCLD